MSNIYGYLVSFAAATGGLLFGYEIGVIGQVLSLDTFKYDMGILHLPLQKNDKGIIAFDEGAKNFVESLTTFIFLFGCASGAMIVSGLADSLGRKRTILLAGILFLVGAIAQTFAPIGGLLKPMFFIGRLIGGLGIGMASMCVPLYIAETAPTEIRGRMITIQQLMITIGILVASIVNAVIISLSEPSIDGFALTDFPKSNEWRFCLSAQMVPAAFLTIIMFFMPESPRWLAMKDRNDECAATLAQLHQVDQSDSKVQSEYKEILENVQHERSIGNGGWDEVFSPQIKRRTFITFMLQFFQQWTGINVIFYYGPSILMNMGLSKHTAQVPGPIVNNFVNFISTFPGMYFVEKYGRRPLFIFGGIGMFVSQYIMTICLSVGQQKDNTLNTIALLAMATFTLSFGSTWGPCAWVYQSEVFPLRVRAKGTGLATFSNWANGALVSFLNPFMQTGIPNQLFAVYGTMDVLATIFAYFMVPETAGKSLEEMEEIFGGSDGSLSGARLEAGKK